jgi:uncharacterized membrane protein
MMPDEHSISTLTKSLLKQSERNIEIWTTFFLEASVLVLVFGILDMYVNDKLTARVGEVVGALGVALLVAAFSVRWAFYRLSRRRVTKYLKLHEQMTGGTK